MAGHPRPLAPHIQIYRRQLTSVLSIFNRITGVILAGGLLYLIAWLIAAATGAAPFNALQDFNGSFIGRFLLFCWTLAFFYHLLNGIRHMTWDAIWGLDLPTVYRTGWATLAGTVLFTLIVWVLAYYQMGSF